MKLAAEIVGGVLALFIILFIVALCVTAKRADELSGRLYSLTVEPRPNWNGMPAHTVHLHWQSGRVTDYTCTCLAPTTHLEFVKCEVRKNI